MLIDNHIAPFILPYFPYYPSIYLFTTCPYIYLSLFSSREYHVEVLYINVSRWTLSSKNFYSFSYFYLLVLQNTLWWALYCFSFKTLATSKWNAVCWFSWSSWSEPSVIFSCCTELWVIHSPDAKHSTATFWWNSRNNSHAPETKRRKNDISNQKLR